MAAPRWVAPLAVSSLLAFGCWGRVSVGEGEPESAAGGTGGGTGGRLTEDGGETNAGAAPSRGGAASSGGSSTHGGSGGDLATGGGQTGGSSGRGGSSAAASGAGGSSARGGRGGTDGASAEGGTTGDECGAPFSYEETVTSQAELETLRGATAIGILTIENVTDLSPLGCLRTVGTLQVENSSIADLEGLTSIESVDYLILKGLPALTSLAPLSEVPMRSVVVGNLPGLDDLRGLEASSKLEVLSLVELTGLESLVGLENLTEVGRLSIEGVPKLVDLAGLEGLIAVDELTLWVNEGLRSIEALGNVTGRVAKLDVGVNAALTSLAGIENMDLSGTIRVHGDNLLPNIDALRVPAVVELIELVGVPLGDLSKLAGLTTVTEGMVLRALDGVSSLHELGNLTSAGPAGLTFSSISGITNLEGLGNLTRTERLQLISNPGLTSLAGLNFALDVDQLKVENCAGLTDLSGLEAITKLERLEVVFNEELVTLTGLENLSELRELWVSENPRLESLHALTSLASIGWARFFQNSSLPDCEKDWLVGQVGDENIAGYLDFTENQGPACPP